MRKSYTLPQLLTKFVRVQSNGCWLWTGKLRQGYGRITYARRDWRAHRLIYVLHGNALPEDQLLLHSCGNKACVNPLHCYLGDGVAANELRERLGHTSRGSALGKLTEAQVIEIRTRRESGVSIKQLALQFGVHTSTIRDIVNRANWRHI